MSFFRADVCPHSAHESHSALRMPSRQPREELQRQPHVNGHKHVRCVNDHGHHGKQDGVEDGLLPRLQHVDAGYEQILIVKPAHILPYGLHVDTPGDAVPP